MQPIGPKEPKPDFEERTLSYFRRYRVPVTVVLLTKAELLCAVTSFGRYTITVLDLDDLRELILYKTAIVSIERALTQERWEELHRPLETKPPIGEG